MKSINTEYLQLDPAHTKSCILKIQFGAAFCASKSIMTRIHNTALYFTK